TFSWLVTHVNRAPLITDPGAQNSVEGASVSLLMAANDPDGDSVTFSASGLPPALGINPTTGLISGTLGATSGGSYTVTVTATDGTLPSSKSFTWTVNDLNHAPTLADPGNQNNAENASVSLTLSGSDIDGDVLSYSATGLPSGLTVNAGTGAIT